MSVCEQSLFESYKPVGTMMTNTLKRGLFQWVHCPRPLASLQFFPHPVISRAQAANKACGRSPSMLEGNISKQGLIPSLNCSTEADCSQTAPCLLCQWVHMRVVYLHGKPLPGSVSEILRDNQITRRLFSYVWR